MQPILIKSYKIESLAYPKPFLSRNLHTPITKRTSYHLVSCLFNKISWPWVHQLKHCPYSSIHKVATISL
ncbi:hypothetical protein BDL97_16G085800 [Sphagnum fallax]|nr:hypothetical protein BDL97_16G085800 [Sphagnum fallax]